MKVLKFCTGIKRGMLCYYLKLETKRIGLIAAKEIEKFIQESKTTIGCPLYGSKMFNGN